MEKSMNNKIKMQHHNGHGIVKELNGYDGVIQYNSPKKKDDFIYISNDSKMEKGIKVGDSVFFEIRYTRSQKHPTLIWADNIEKDYSQKGKDMKRRVNPSTSRGSDQFISRLSMADALKLLQKYMNYSTSQEIVNAVDTYGKQVIYGKNGDRVGEISQFGSGYIFTEEAKRSRSNPKAGFDWNSKKVYKDLLSFFEGKFPQKDISEIKEEIEESLTTSGARYDASVTIDGEEFNLIEDSDKFHDTAIEYVTQMIDDEPENFNQSFIQNHIYITDTDKSIIAGEEADAYYDDMKDREIEREYERKNGEIIGEEDEPDYDAMREELKSDYSDNIEKELDDPIGYFVDQQGIYTLEELLKSSFIRIDTEDAAAAAVSEDGEAHFLSHYDGNYEETNGGIIVMKE
jgi:hypothetical protein